MDDDTTYASLPTIPNGDATAKENTPVERQNGDLPINGQGSRPPSASEYCFLMISRNYFSIYFLISDRSMDNHKAYSPNTRRSAENHSSNEKATSGMNGISKDDQKNGSAFELYKKENAAMQNGTNGELSDGR